MKMSVLFAAFLMFSASVVQADEVFKRWNGVPSKEIIVSQSANGRGSLEMAPEVKTPDGKSAMMLNITMNEGKRELDLVLKFLCTDKSLKAGEEYELAFLYKASAPCRAVAVAAMGGNPSWNEFQNGRKILNFKTEWQTAVIRFVAPEKAVPPLNLPRVMCGECPAGVKLYFGDVVLKEIENDL